MQINETFPFKGIFEMTVYSRGKIIETYRAYNLIVDGARTQAIRLFTGKCEGRAIAKIAFGTSGTPPTLSDTAVTNAFTKDISSFYFPSNTSLKTNWTLDTDEANGMQIMEFALLSADGTLLYRRVREKPIHKNDDISIAGGWTWLF